MHYNRFIFAALATLLVSSSMAAEDVTINNIADAWAYNPTHDHQEQNFDDDTWHGTTSITALSESHPFDPPINIAKAMTEFVQPDYTDATLRSSSFVLSDYSGIGLTTGYKATTHFFLHQYLSVTSYSPFAGQYDLQLLVPMHGLMAARSNSSGSLSKATIGLGVAVFGNTIADFFEGGLELTSTDSSTNFTASATGGFVGDFGNAVVDLPTGDQPRSWAGVELMSSALLDLGRIQNNIRTDFEIFYDFTTTAEIESPNGSFALSDFSGTGGLTFRAIDDQGNEIPGITVELTHGAVPEPASFMAVGLGLVALLRRRRS